MEIKKINQEKSIEKKGSFRPDSFDSFVGQEHIKSILQTAIHSSQKRKGQIGHILFSGPSGFGKTTIAGIVSKQNNVGIKIVTGYAISKPAEIVSILNNLEEGDILFVDEIHRLRPNIEEVLYIAMEDFVIDMVMPEGGNVRIPINPFTLIGATTKSEQLSPALKNRFVYNFHFMDYNNEEKINLIERYLKTYGIGFEKSISQKIAEKVDSVPREIHNLCVKIRDFVITQVGSNSANLIFDHGLFQKFIDQNKIDNGGLNQLHQKYLHILSSASRPMGVKAIAIQLGVNEKAVEEDIEPLLLKLGKIEKTIGGRIIIG